LLTSIYQPSPQELLEEDLGLDDEDFIEEDEG
jgi:hypothetical protein